MAKKPHFSPKLFKFLRDLAANNDREWFNAHKAQYVDHVQGPLLAFIGDFAPRLTKISSHYVADPKPVGGSMFRIYRDVRFSKDKSPYKTAASAQFRHEEGKGVHAPGFYLHLEPGSVFAGFGSWRPDATTANRFRDAIVGGAAGWKRAVNSKAFHATCRLSGESLKRPPRGYDPNHPLIEDLKRKDFIAVADFTQKDACAADFMDRFTSVCKSASPFMRFLAKAIDMPY